MILLEMRYVRSFELYEFIMSRVPLAVLPA
jgi:hypothetical protein